MGAFPILFNCGKSVLELTSWHLERSCQRKGEGDEIYPIPKMVFYIRYYCLCPQIAESHRVLGTNNYNEFWTWFSWLRPSSDIWAWWQIVSNAQCFFFRTVSFEILLRRTGAIGHPTNPEKSASSFFIIGSVWPIGDQGGNAGKAERFPEGNSACKLGFCQHVRKQNFRPWVLVYHQRSSVHWDRSHMADLQKAFEEHLKPCTKRIRTISEPSEHHAEPSPDHPNNRRKQRLQPLALKAWAQVPPKLSNLVPGWQTSVEPLQTSCPGWGKWMQERLDSAYFTSKFGICDFARQPVNWAFALQRAWHFFSLVSCLLNVSRRIACWTWDSSHRTLVQDKQLFTRHKLYEPPESLLVGTKTT